MKKIYLLALFLFTISTVRVTAQCNLQAPVVTGNTLICNNSGSFTLNATTPSTLTTAWYALPEGGNAISTGSAFASPNLPVGTTTYYVGQNSSVSTTSITQPPHVTTILAMSRGYWFVAPVSFIITGIRVPMEASQGVPSMAIIKLTAPPPTYPSVTNAFTTLYLNQLANTGPNIAPCYIPINQGDVIGVLGDRNDTTSYSPNPYSGTIGSTPITLTRMGMLFNLSTNVPQDIWTESINNIGRVQIYTTLGCVSPLTPVPVTVSVPPVLSITGPPGSICAGASTTLTGNGASTYSWTGGPVDANYPLTPVASSGYTLSGSNAAGCTASTSIQVTVTPLPNVIIASSNTVICLGQTGTLTLSGASTYTWSSGFNNPVFQISPVVSTTYMVSGTDANGCVNSVSLVMPVSPLPTVTATSSKSISCAGQPVTLTASGTGVTSYSWSTGAQGSTLVVSPNASATYTATGINAAGCAKSFVVSVSVVSCVGLNEISTDNRPISIFPNPSNGQLTIQSSDIIRGITIMDINGKVISKQQFEALTELSLDVEFLPAGVYLLAVKRDQGEKMLRLIKE